MRDYYEILGVTKSATADELKRAYRRLSKEHHPDRNPDDASAEGKFKEVQGAYEVLKDPEKRAQYDRFGPAAVGNWHTDQSGQKVYAWSEGGPEISFDDLGDLFSAFRGYGDTGGQDANPFADLFGRGGRARRPVAQRGQDLERSVNLSFEQAAKGTTLEIDIIGGAGQRQTLDVKIPAAVKPGQRIRLKGKGQLGSSGGPPGDLYLAVTVRAHRLFRRQGQDVLIDLPLTIVEASLGATVDIPTLDGTVSLKVPPGTGGGVRLRLAGRGIRPERGAAGDLYAVVRIDPIKAPSQRQRDLLQELADTLDGDPREKLT